MCRGCGTGSDASLIAVGGDLYWARIGTKVAGKHAVDALVIEVMLDAQLEARNAPTAAIPISSNLTVHVGNDVRIDTFGLGAFRSDRGRQG